MKNPKSQTPHEEHPFSIASSPQTKDYLEFCIRAYGDWTEELMRSTIGDTLQISDPHGNFTWDNTIQNALFLAGGIGISPIMSMLRFITHTSLTPQITLLYGNRTPETVMYKKEIEEIFSSHPDWHLVHIYSHLPDDHPWTGYRGFITHEILEREGGLSAKPTVFIIGPPIFIEKMQHELEQFSVSEDHIKTELLA